MSETQTHKHNGISGKAPVPVFTSSNDRIKITYAGRPKLKEVRCKCGKLQCKASVGSIIESKCKCGVTETYKVAA